MAITATYLKRAEAVDVTANNGAATFSINLGDKPGKDVIIIAENTSTASAMTATLEIVAGDYLASATGDNAITLGAGAVKAIALSESARYKNTAGEVDCKLSITASGDVRDVKISVIKLP